MAQILGNAGFVTQVPTSNTNNTTSGTGTSTPNTNPDIPFDLSGIADGDLLVYNSTTGEIEPFSQAGPATLAVLAANLTALLTPNNYFA